MKASGTFDVELKPMDAHGEGAGGVTLGRLSINKTFHGDLDATSVGEMLSATTSTEGSAGYVAIEQVTGTLRGKTGSFALQHYGTMDAGLDFLLLEIVPGSPSGELDGLAGTFAIRNENGQHSYEFDYELEG